MLHQPHWLHQTALCRCAGPHWSETCRSTRLHPAAAPDYTRLHNVDVQAAKGHYTVLYTCTRPRRSDAHIAPESKKATTLGCTRLRQLTPDCDMQKHCTMQVHQHAPDGIMQMRQPTLYCTMQTQMCPEQVFKMQIRSWPAQDYSMQKHQPVLDSTIQSTGLQPYSCIMQLHKTAPCGFTSLHSSSMIEADEGCRITAGGLL
jgi:hypothetical protein